MGQYYRPVVTMNGKTTIFGNRTALITEEDKSAFRRNNYSNYHGLKILEHSWWGNDLVKGVVGRLYNRRGRVAWIGDYTEDIMEEIVSNDGTKAPMSPIELYSGSVYARTPNGEYARDNRGYKIELENEPLPEGVKKYRGFVIYNPNFTLNGKIIINHSLKEYLECDTYRTRSTTDDGWCINPIPLLTSTGGDQGGGDYHRNHIDAAYVGHWAYDEISIKDCTPALLNKLERKGYKELIVTFNEEIDVPVVGVD